MVFSGAQSRMNTWRKRKGNTKAPKQGNEPSTTDLERQAKDQILGARAWLTGPAAPVEAEADAAGCAARACVLSPLQLRTTALPPAVPPLRSPNKAGSLTAVARLGAVAPPSLPQPARPPMTQGGLKGGPLAQSFALLAHQQQRFGPASPQFQQALLPAAELCNQSAVALLQGGRPADEGEARRLLQQAMALTHAQARGATSRRHGPANEGAAAAWC